MAVSITHEAESAATGTSRWKSVAIDVPPRLKVWGLLCQDRDDSYQRLSLLRS